jgi:hypothetical protein
MYGPPRFGAATCIMHDDFEVLRNDSLVLTQRHTKSYTRGIQQNAHQILQQRHTKPYGRDIPNPWQNNNNKQTTVALNARREQQRWVLGTHGEGSLVTMWP